MSKLIKRTAVEIPGDEPISEAAVERAAYLFEREVATRPDKLFLTRADMSALHENIAVSHVPEKVTEFNGIKIVIDPSLPINGWYVAKEESKVFEVKP